jgi:hypothetical protein
VLRLGFRNGKPLPAEVICEQKWGDEGGLDLAGSDVRVGRYFVSQNGGVLDLREKKLINAERYGVVVHTDDTKVTYVIKDQKGRGELFAFDYATRKRTRLERLPSVPTGIPYSPDGTKAIDRAGGELTVRRAGRKPKSLGTGFDLGPSVSRWTGTERTDRYDTFETVFWLDDDRILAHRKGGKVVAVGLDGEVTEVVTIEGVPNDAVAELSRDPGGGLVYSFCPQGEWPRGEKRFKIDLAKKTATPTDWIDLGHGFEGARDPELGWQFDVRHNGKRIGQLALARPEHAVSAPGYLAIMAAAFHGGVDCSDKVGVWSAATGEWTVHEHGCAGVLGLVK